MIRATRCPLTRPFTVGHWALGAASAASDTSAASDMGAAVTRLDGPQVFFGGPTARTEDDRVAPSVRRSDFDFGFDWGANVASVTPLPLSTLHFRRMS